MSKQKTLLNFLFLIAILAMSNSHEQLAIDAQKWSSGNYLVAIMKEQTVLETKEIHVVR